MNNIKLRRLDHSGERLKYLTILSDYLIKENENLKVELEDMKMTVLHNKEMLKEYINNITNRDKIVQKLQCTIDTLTERIKSQDDVIKRMINQNKDYARIINTCKTSKTEDNNEISCMDSVFTSSTPKNSNITNWGYIMDPKVKESFTNKQNVLLNELNQLKYDFKYIVEKYEELSRKKKKEHSCDELNVNSLNASIVSSFSTDTVIKKKVDLKKKFVNINGLQGVFNNYDEDSVLLLIDGRNEVWEIIKREDLNMTSLKNIDTIVSYKKKAIHNDNNLNLDLKEIHNSSLNTSYMNTVKNEFNISILIKD